jgi:large subunit ribosomal protein L24
MKIKSGDTVAVIAGKQKGVKGKVLRAFPREDLLLVEGVNMKKRHRRGRRRSEKGQIVDVAHPIHASNVMLLDPQTGKPTRVGRRIEGERKVRVARKSGAII